MAHEEERFVLRAFLHEVDGKVGNQIRGVAAGKLVGFSHLNEKRVMVAALAWENIPIIKTGRFTSQMPLADHAGVIARFLQFLGNRPLAAVETIKNRNAIDVRIFAGEDRRAARSANGVDRKTIAETHSFFSDAVDVWRLVDLAAVGADGVGRMVIRHNENDIRAGGMRVDRLGEKGKKESQQNQSESFHSDAIIGTHGLRQEVTSGTEF